MEELKERLFKNVSTGELERRWKAAREVMKERKIDFLLMRQDEEYYGGHVRWFTGIAPRHSYPFTVIFPIDEEMTTITSSPPNSPGPPDWAIRGIKKKLGAPYYPSLHYTSAYDAELAVDVLGKKKGATIGFVGMLTLHVPFYLYLTQHLTGHTFVDMTESVDILRAVKSPEEIEFIKGTAALQDAAMEHLKKTLRTGHEGCRYPRRGGLRFDKAREHPASGPDRFLSSRRRACSVPGTSLHEQDPERGRSDGGASRGKRPGRVLHRDLPCLLLRQTLAGIRGYVRESPRSPEADTQHAETRVRIQRTSGMQTTTSSKRSGQPRRAECMRTAKDMKWSRGRRSDMTNP